jgi:hypothetical protein
VKRTLTRALIALALLAAIAATLVASLSAIAWQALAARDGEWSLPLRFTLAGHRFEQRASVALLLRAATHPLAAPLLDDRTVDTAQGRWRLDVSDGTLGARCAPCRFTLAALGPSPLVVDEAELRLRPEGADRYRGSLRLGPVGRALHLEGLGRFERDGQRLVLGARLAPTPIAHALQVFGRDLPERDRVQVHGRIALALSLQWPDGPLRATPTLDGFEVHGLGTERLADLERPAACRVDASTEVPALTRRLPRAVVAAEDQRFFEHPGYDPEAMVDAWTHNQRPGGALAGASTITQQLAKLTVAGDERSATRKLRELLYAVEMERTLGKARILQLYLALAPWGEGVCGAERAARVHLGQRDASAVGPLAAAWLASLLPAPDALLQADQARGAVDEVRVAHVLEAMRPMSAQRREKALATLPFWTPATLSRPPREAPP